jgi:hypothetical protein
MGKENAMKFSFNHVKPILMLDNGNLIRIETVLRENDITGSNIRINPTLYKINNEFRYIRSVLTLESTVYIYSLESMDSNRLLHFVVQELNSKTLTISELVAAITAYIPTSNSEALAYINFLLASSILMNDLMLNITGVDYLKRAERHLAGFPVGIPFETNGALQIEEGVGTSPHKNLVRIKSEQENGLEGYQASAKIKFLFGAYPNRFTRNNRQQMAA